MHPFTQIEKMFAENRIAAYEVTRVAGKYTVSLDYIEFDEDTPEGSPCSTYGRGATLAAALDAAMVGLPAVPVEGLPA